MSNEWNELRTLGFFASLPACHNTTKQKRLIKRYQGIFFCCYFIISHEVMSNRHRSLEYGLKCKRSIVDECSLHTTTRGWKHSPVLFRKSQINHRHSKNISNPQLRNLVTPHMKDSTCKERDKRKKNVSR